MANQKPEVAKPYLKGALLDERSLPASLRFFGLEVAMTVAFLLLGALGLSDLMVLRIIINAGVLTLVYVLFYNGGLGRGTADVALGETLYVREQNGNMIDAAEQKRAFHIGKGWLIGLLGSLPLLLCAVVLALTAEKQMSGLGVLPSWVTGLMTRSEVSDALGYMQASSPMTLPIFVRMIVRMAIMPYISMVGLEASDTLLLVERISPLLVLLPAFLWGLGYIRGRNVRAMVHTSIAKNNRKRARREKKQREARRSDRQMLN